MKSILIVEDDSDIRKQLAAILEMEGYIVHQTGNGREALDFLLQLPASKLPGCIILDLMMPVMDGKKFLETIEEEYEDRFKNIHIIVATAKGSPINPGSLPKAVIRIQKPFDLDQLYEVIEDCCK